MFRLLAVAVIALIANGIALIVGDLILDKMSLSAASFVIAVLIFTCADILFSPLINQIASTRAPVLLGSTSLVSTLIALILTTLISDGLSISGISTWIAATVIIWLIALVLRLVLPYVLFKKTLAKRAAA
jgi:putative membrane protein